MGKYCKTVLINRAVPGSGKTTFSKRIYEAVESAGLSIAVHSTDEFFMVGSRYEFELEKLGEYHKKNLANFVESLKKGIDLVVVDNTNLKPWESEPYTNAARAAGYRIVLFNFLPREFEKHLAAQQITPEKPDAHQVSAELLKRFIAEFHLYNDLLDKNFVPDPKVHINCVWDEETMQLKKVNSPVHHFDYDDMLVIDPKEYHMLKDKIGEMMLTRFCLSSESEDKQCRAYVDRKGRGAVLIGRITCADKGWLMVRLSGAPLSVRAYVDAKSIVGIDLVQIKDLIDRDFEFSIHAYHEYDRTIELECRSPEKGMSERRPTLQMLVDEIVASKRRDFLYSLKVGNVYYGIVTEINDRSYIRRDPRFIEDHFKIDLGHGLICKVPKIEVTDIELAYDEDKIDQHVVLGQKVPVKVLAVNEMTGEVQLSFKAALAALAAGKAAALAAGKAAALAAEKAAAALADSKKFWRPLFWRRLWKRFF